MQEIGTIVLNTILIFFAREFIKKEITLQNKQINRSFEAPLPLDSNKRRTIKRSFPYAIANKRHIPFLLPLYKLILRERNLLIGGKNERQRKWPRVGILLGQKVLPGTQRGGRVPHEVDRRWGAKETFDTRLETKRQRAYQPAKQGFAP